MLAFFDDEFKTNRVTGTEFLDAQCATIRAHAPLITAYMIEVYAYISIKRKGNENPKIHQ